MSQKKKKCAYRYTFSRPDKKDVDTRELPLVLVLYANEDSAVNRPELQEVVNTAAACFSRVCVRGIIAF